MTAVQIELKNVGAIHELPLHFFVMLNWKPILFIFQMGT